MARVALVKGDDRFGNIARALDLMADQTNVGAKQRILIKPNFVSTRHAPAATHVDAVRAVLEFLCKRTDAWITIAEGAAIGDTFDGFRNYGYTELTKQYPVELVDLNRCAWVEAPVYDARFNTFMLRLAKPVVESDFRISVGPPKTHDTVLITLSLKNMVMGSLIGNPGSGQGGSPVMQVMGALNRTVPARFKNAALAEPAVAGAVRRFVNSDKRAMHMGYQVINLNLYRLAPHVYPHLAVIDGFVGMEGPGPAYGDPVDLRCAVAGTDFLAVDTVAAALMGFDIDEVGYLHYCKVKGLGEGNLQRIEIVGNALAECRRPFCPPPGHDEQRRWQIKDVEHLL